MSDNDIDGDIGKWFDKLKQWYNDDIVSFLVASFAIIFIVGRVILDGVEAGGAAILEMSILYLIYYFIWRAIKSRNK